MVNVEEKNYYELLRLDRNATVEQIKDAYHEIAKVYHPDSNFYAEIVPEHSSGDGVDMFKLITDAYNTLINKERRARYDETLPPEFTDWDDVSNEIYLRELYAEKALKEDVVVNKPRRKTANFGSAELRAQLEKERKAMQEAEQLKNPPEPRNWLKAISFPAIHVNKAVLTNLSFVLIYLGIGLIVGAITFVGLSVLFE